jgi:hypothetical protein
MQTRRTTRRALALLSGLGVAVLAARFHVRFTPTGSSRLNQVERWFGLLTDKLIRRGVHTSVHALEKDIQNWIDTWNANPRPFTWVKTAGDILNSLADYLAKMRPSSTDSNQHVT